MRRGADALRGAPAPLLLAALWSMPRAPRRRRMRDSPHRRLAAYPDSTWGDSVRNPAGRFAVCLALPQLPQGWARGKAVSCVGAYLTAESGIKTAGAIKPPPSVSVDVEQPPPEVALDGEVPVAASPLPRLTPSWFYMKKKWIKFSTTHQIRCAKSAPHRWCSRSPCLVFPIAFPWGLTLPKMRGLAYQSGRQGSRHQHP